MSVNELKAMSLEDLLRIDASKLTTEEVAYLEKRLVQTANRRITRLKKAGKLGVSKISRQEKKGFKTYKAPKGYKPKVTKSGEVSKSVYTKEGGKKNINVRNKRIEKVSKVQEFLRKKTSTVKGTNKQLERYKGVIKNTTGYEGNISDRQAKRISKLMERAKEMGIGNDANKKFSGSPRLLSLVVDIVKSKKYIKNDEAELIIQNAINNGYEEAQRTLIKLRGEDIEGLDVEEDTDDEEVEDYDDYFNLF